MGISDLEKTQIIRSELQKISAQFRTKHVFLKHQDILGFSIFFVSCLMFLFGGWSYVNGWIPIWAVIIWNAFWASILHELEHDLIHFMYFKKNKFMQNIMMLGVWIFRPLTLNPWLRREIHLHHHKVSGTPIDIEERGVSNGEKWGLIRLFTLSDIFLAGAWRSYRIKKDMNTPELKKLFLKVKYLGMLPFPFVCYLILYSYLLPFHHPLWLNHFVVIFLLPNVLRMFCLHLITSNMHYYGDVELGNIMQQTQVLNKWYLAPFHFFCFNFGSTHAIHHFWVNETFYIRQLTASRAHEIMRKQGVRFNDMHNFVRANRYFRT